MEELLFLEKYRHAAPSEIFSLTKTAGSQRLFHQLFARQDATKKFPFLYTNEQIVYPISLSNEQASSERTAAFKASLLKGKRFIDLSGGMGIDSYFLAQQFEFGIVVERDAELAKITSHNFALLEQVNVQFAIGMNAEEFLSQYQGTADLVYLDPARRDQKGGKIVKLADCDPDITTLLPHLWKMTDSVLIKTSPLLDIQAATGELKHVKNVYVVAVENECKELLFHLEKDFIKEFSIHAVNFEKEKSTTFSFTLGEEKSADPQVGDIQKYLYEPNAAILKAGAFKVIAHSFQVKKLHPHSHVYTTDTLLNDFPGRRFEIIHVTNVDKKELFKFIPAMKANLSIRNFPGSVQDLRKKLGLTDGGDFYLFATTDHKGHKCVIITKKV